MPVPRFAPELPFPAYAFVPGRSPHPTSDPHGHSYGRSPAIPDSFDPQQWNLCQPYLYGIDLFNHGYYWEAHELWEGLWHASGRRGPTADLFKALIALAAAGVKVRTGTPAGVVSHARRASELLNQLIDQGTNRSLGLDLADLRRFANALANDPTPRASISQISVVFDFQLLPK
jgi:predicted metal-dependent hydrolase